MITANNDSLWEGNNLHDLLVLLIGFELGPTPELHVDKIRAWRSNIIDFFDECFLQFRGSETVLEIGSGCGFTSRAIAPRVKRLECIDLSETFLSFARDECAAIENINFHRCSYTDLAHLADASIDSVVASAVFIHTDLYAVNLFFAELARVVKPGGRVAFDFLDANRLKPSESLFRQHTNEYRAKPAAYPELCKWNSGSALVRIAESHGFVATIFPQRGMSNTMFLAQRGRTSRFRLHATGWLRMRQFARRYSRDYLNPPRP